ncbi:hypothetical protein SERLA73DRAFT_175972 [Serpula lacrymans var. lacrymans S7.3]|uniref:DUF4219 domain-containing protein n=1 Tax=Serpula lacrymans var. lacrymans (strain S7.3) TaxID=936435 RepID=F8PLQ2_SERL3|nr:hypothetical protein SERLA73DRAFT_175972 [Serpula lacrymans var. lacrymans S7.3]
MSDSDPKFHPLSGTNYPQWSGEMQAWLMTKGLWRLVSGAEKCPGTDTEAIEKWELRAEKAAGALYLNIWEKLAVVHVSKKPGTRFNAYDDFFSIRKKEDESLQSLMTRIDEGMHQIQNLRPTGFSFSELDDELTCMAMIRALPDQYAHFTSSLLLLGTLDKTQLRDAFLAEEVNHCRRAEVNSALHSSSTTANSTCTHPNCHHCNQSTTSIRV